VSVSQRVFKRRESNRKMVVFVTAHGPCSSNSLIITPPAAPFYLSAPAPPPIPGHPQPFKTRRRSRPSSTDREFYPPNRTHAAVHRGGAKSADVRRPLERGAQQPLLVLPHPTQEDRVPAAHPRVARCTRRYLLDHRQSCRAEAVLPPPTPPTSPPPPTARVSRPFHAARCSDTPTPCALAQPQASPTAASALAAAPLLSQATSRPPTPAAHHGLPSQ
jgi:hypothetical protein